MVDIIRGSSEKYAVTKSLVEYFNKRDDIEGILYLGYPIIGSVDGAIDIDAMLISKQHGVVVIDLVESVTPENRMEIQDDLYMKVKSKLEDYKALTHKRKLMVDIGAVTYASGWRNVDEEELEFDLATNHDELDKFLEDQQWNNSDYYNKLLQAIQAVTNIKAAPKRENVKKENSKGAILQRLEDSIANLDRNQSAAVIETADGPQRIRGLAGSGKTIVLALKVAYLHAKNPDWKIAVSFNTRSLKKQFEDLITRFTYEHKRDNPDWSKVKILQAWGSPANSGIYYEVCKNHNIEYYDLNKAKSSFFGPNYFKQVCRKALEQIESFEPLYDVILIDEAQDFSQEFLRLCYEILESPKRLIFAYDELQSLNKLSMATTEEIFGVDDQGTPRVILRNEVDKPKQDIILKVCYRNSRPVLATAHALGFGIYNENGIIQMFDEKSLWKDVGYEVLNGELNEAQPVKLGRSPDASPRFLETHSDINDLIQFESFKNDEEQAEWIAQQIKNNLEVDELRHQDIMVIHTDPLSTQNAVAGLRAKLFQMGINSHIAGAANPDIFVENNSITFTGIYRAKGNEAGMIYVMNAQNCYGGLELSSKRNILFTAITRSKGWVRVTGYGDSMDKLINEYQEVKAHNFELDFVYPTQEERKRMNVIHRDMTKDQQRKIEMSINNLAELITALKNGEIYIEDLPPELTIALKGLLKDE